MSKNTQLKATRKRNVSSVTAECSGANPILDCCADIQSPPQWRTMVSGAVHLYCWCPWSVLCAAAPPPPTECRVATALFSWRVHVMLYTSYMLLDFCNAVYDEAWTLTKSSKNDAGVFCNSPRYSNETRQRQTKSVFVDSFVKMKADAKSFVWNFFGNWVNNADGTVKYFNSVYCNNCS